MCYVYVSGGLVGVDLDGSIHHGEVGRAGVEVAVHLSVAYIYIYMGYRLQFTSALLFCLLLVREIGRSRRNKLPRRTKRDYHLYST